MNAHPYLQHHLPVAFAHRGGTETGAENTMAAFEHAYDAGLRYMETDVHRTRDGVLVAFHDRNLRRLAGRDALISDLSWRDLAAVELRGGGRVPRLDELFERWPEVRWNLDPKSDDVVEPLAARLAGSALLERICVGSFGGRRLKRMRALLGEGLCSSAAPAEVMRCLARRRGLPVPLRLPPSVRCLQVPHTIRGVPVVDAGLVRWAHLRGLQVHVWTIDEPAEMETLLDAGVDGIMTDKPMVLRQVLERRGVWRSE